MTKAKILPIISVVLCLALSAISAYGQNPPGVEQKSDKSACSNIVALAGNISVNCSSLTPEQKIALERIPAILNKILANELDANLVMKKLDEMIQANSRPTETVNAPNGIGSIGSTLINPQVNNYRNPLPQIDVSESSPVPAEPVPQSTEPRGVHHRPGMLYGNPGASVIVTVKSIFYDPAFIAECSVPCRFALLSEERGDGSAIFNTSNFSGLGNASHMAAGVAYAKQLPPGSRVRLVFESLDERPLTVSNVQPYAY
jgi:hypothetical protein